MKKTTKKEKSKEKLYICNSTDAIVKQIGKKFLLPTGFVGKTYYINAMIIEHILEDDIGSVYEYKLSELTKVKA